MKISTFVWIGIVLAGLALLAALLSGTGYRLGFWSFRAGIMVFKYSIYAAILALIVNLFCILRRSDGKIFAVAGAVISLLIVAAGLYWNQRRSVPMIHDITTDTMNPPPFVALLETRRKCLNGADYGGPEVAAAQLKAYPDLKTVELASPIDQAFEKALAAANQMKWEIADANKSDGRIEATATTRLFHFKDDVIVRMKSAGNMTLVDVRSASRVGKSDLGTNARRIRKFLGLL